MASSSTPYELPLRRGLDHQPAPARKVHADHAARRALEQLAQLLKLEDSVDLTYFNLQRYMSPHFAKASNKDTVASK